MKKTKLTLFVAVIAVALFGMGCASAGNAKLKTFSNELIEKAIRQDIGKPEGELTEADYLRVKHLDLRKKGISDISTIAKCKNVTNITITRHHIEDLSPLKDLVKIQYLWLHDGNISDLSPLTDLTKLETLMVAANKVSDLGPLSNLKELHILDMANNKIKEVSALGGLKNLQVLSLRENRVEDLRGLNDLPSLRILDLYDNPVKDLSPIKGLLLNSLFIDRTYVDSLDPLKNMNSLRRLGTYGLSITKEAIELIDKFKAEAK